MSFLILITCFAGLAPAAWAQVTPLPNWNQQNPASSPSARAGATVAYDANHGQVVLFGGSDGTNNLNDTWTWDGSNWTQQSPASSPPARNEATMAYDANHDQVVLFGGSGNSGFLSDTWTWDGSNWTQQSPTSSPSARDYATMAYDANHGQAVLFGGVSNVSLLNDTWTWDGSNWTPQSPASGPSARDSATMAYDANHGQTVLFGGFDATNNSLNDTWTWDGTNWTQRTPANIPPARDYATMAYDANLGQVVLFSGAYTYSTGGGFLNDTWVWDGSNWTQLSPASSPSSRAFATMAYDASHNQAVLFGGLYYTYLNDTWTLQIGSFNFSSANVCLGGATPAPCIQSGTLSYAVSSGTTIGSVNIFTQGAPSLDFIATPGDISTTLCTATAYDSDTVCTVDVTFAPLRPGQRLGAVVLTDGTGTPLATTYLSGTGVGPLVNFATVNAGAYIPSALTTLGSGFSYPLGVAVDASGNVFVADTIHNAVKEIVAAGGYTTINTLGSGFNDPRGVAVDGSGNVFVADWNNSKVKEMVAVNGSIPASSPTILTLGSGFDLPTGLAVDGSGNVFVADRQNNEVKEMVAVNGSIPASPTILTLGSGFDLPTGVAVDASGNVFVADNNNNAVKEIAAVNGSIPASPTILTLSSGFSHPSGVAVDGSGNVFVADYNNNAVKEIVAVNGSIPASPTILTLGSGFSYPAGVAVDGSGNVFVADNNNNAAKKLDFADPPSLSFASSNVGTQSSDSPQSVTVTNVGNAGLVFPVPGSGTNPAISSGFALDTVTTCPQLTTSSSAATLAMDANCVYAIDFTPAVTGANSGSLTLANNSLNVSSATQAINLNGTGLGQAPAITSANSSMFTVGTNGSFTVQATGYPAPTFGETGTLPGGVTLNASTGVLGGMPASGAGGSYPITITASNGVLPNSTQNFTLTVDQAPAIISANSTTFKVGAAGTFTVTATGYPASFSLGESGALPGGVTFNVATGVLSGTPASGTSGTYKITFTASNGVAPNATQNFTLNVSSSVLRTITVAPANASVPAGLTQQFSATAHYSDGSTQDVTSGVTWTSSATFVARITSGGLATGVAQGRTTITAAQGSIRGSTTLTVIAPLLQSIDARPSNASIFTGQSQQYVALGHFSNGSAQNISDTVRWSSSNVSVATINPGGSARGVGVGTITITATRGGVSGTASLTVNPVLVSITVTPANPSIKVGIKTQFTATGTYSDRSKQDLTASARWTSSSTGVATINAAGLATGASAGRTTIRATVGQTSGTTQLTVTR